MQARKILFPTDFSTTGDNALEYATTFARESGARLLIVHVEELPMVYGEGAYYYGVPAPERPVLQKMLNAIKPHDTSVAYEHRLIDGVPSEAIVALAKREGVDLIVMSSHGRTGLGRLLMGSVAEQVLRHAACPVLVVKPTAKGPVPVATSSKA